MVKNSETRMDFVLKRINDVSPICSGCGKIHDTPIHSLGCKTVEDLPISGKRVFLHVPIRKLPCIEDNTIRVEELNWIRGRFTKRFADQVFRLTSITTNKEAGWYLGLIDKGMLEELAHERLYPVSCPCYMSVDEVAWQKWHRYVTNVVDIETHKVIWNHNGRGKHTLDSFYQEIGKDKLNKIKAVANDGAKGLILLTKEHAKNALIVLDHFHVKKYLNDAVDKVRKEELKRAKEENNSELSQILHCNKRFILMQNKVTTKKRDLLERLSHLNQRIYQAMLLKEQFLLIYSSQDRKTAFTNLKEWIVTAIKSQIPSFVELGYKFFRKRHYILNYFTCKYRRESITR